jgi:dolichol-phosphate mannosyltransferase
MLFMVMVIDRFIVHLGFDFSGPAMLATMILFLVGIVLIALGLIAYYIGHIYHDVQDRPLYIVRRPRNKGSSQEVSRDYVINKSKITLP